MFIFNVQPCPIFLFLFLFLKKSPSSPLHMFAFVRANALVKRSCEHLLELGPEGGRRMRLRRFKQRLQEMKEFTQLVNVQKNLCVIGIYTNHEISYSA